MENLVKNIRQFILIESINKNSIHEKEILIAYYHILDEWVKDHISYRKFSPHLLNTFEQYSDKSLSYSIFIYLNLYEQVIRLPVKKKLDTSIVDLDYSDKTIENIKKILEENLSKMSIRRISDNEVLINNFSENEIKEMISFLADKLENYSIMDYVWKLEQVDSTVFDLIWLRALCSKIGQSELFYYLINAFFDRLSTSEFYQIARDLCEEILIASIHDKLTFYGFFICFRVYSNQKSIHGALMYGNLFLTSLMKEKSISSYKLQFELIWQSIKFFRNCKLYDWGIKVYDTSPKNIQLSNYERHSLDSSYYTCRMEMKDSTVSSSLLDYLNQERENILTEGVNGCIPWLITIYNLKRIDGLYNYKNSGLESYLILFESIVPIERVEKLKNIIFGNSDELKIQLKESLLKLARTRNKSDFVYDNEMAIMIASRLVDQSFAKEDAESIMLAMQIKADYSINFIEKESQELAVIDTTEINHELFYETFDNPIENLETLQLSKSESVVWLVNSEDKLYQATYNQNNFSYNNLENWDSTDFRIWINEKLANFKFDTTSKDKHGNIKSLFIEDYEDQSKKIRDEIYFLYLSNVVGLQKLLLIKDMAISELPHNLLLDENKEFIALNTSITNVHSIEWLNKKLKEKPQTFKNEKSIYIPTEGGDFTINLLFESIKDTLFKHHVTTNTFIKNFSPINSTINIVASHGGKDISSTQIIYTDDNHAIFNLNGILGEGKILILFVCHSGSTKEFFFRNEIASLTKKYLTNGYHAVIAPFWSLHINIPPLWLPIFLKAIDNGSEVGTAVFEANKGVFEAYPTPVAWGCMHLYGNPFFKLICD